MFMLFLLFVFNYCLDMLTGSQMLGLDLLAPAERHRLTPRVFLVSQVHQVLHVRSAFGLHPVAEGFKGYRGDLHFTALLSRRERT